MWATIAVVVLVVVVAGFVYSGRNKGKLTPEQEQQAHQQIQQQYQSYFGRMQGGSR